MIKRASRKSRAPGPDRARSGSSIDPGVTTVARRGAGAVVLLATVVLAGPVGCSHEDLQLAWSNLTREPPTVSTRLDQGGRSHETALDPAFIAAVIEEVMVLYREHSGGGSNALSSMLPSHPSLSQRTQGEGPQGAWTEVERHGAMATWAPEPVISEARASALRVRPGEPVEIQLRAENRGGLARRGTLRVRLMEHPPMRLGFRSERLATHFFEGEDSPKGYGARPGEALPAEIRAIGHNWETGEAHILELKLIPTETGVIQLSYQLELEGRDGVVATHPHGEEYGAARSRGGGVTIQVTRTLSSGERQ